MPKKIFKIDQFHGGLNNHSDARDINDNQQSSLIDAMVDSLGQITTMGVQFGSDIATANNTGITGTMKAGYGIHAWKSDYTGAEDKGSNEATTGDDYVAMYDGDDGQVWVYSAARDTFDDDVNLSAGNGILDIGSSTTASALPVFYSIEGGLRISDGNHALNNNSKTYQYIDRTLFQSITNTVVTDGWFDYDQYISAPADTSRWDPALTAYSVAPGHNLNITGLTTADKHITSKALFDATGNVENFRTSIEVTVTITTATVSGIPGETDFDVTFNLTSGSGTASAFNGVSGASYQVTSQSEMGSPVSSATKDIVYTFNLGNNYHNGTSNNAAFITGDTTNGVRTLLAVTSSGKFISGTLITAVKVTEGAITRSDHTSLSQSGVPNVFLEVETTAAPTSGIVASGWDSSWEYGVSFIYDGKQESLIRTLFDPDTSPTTVHSITNASFAPIVKFYIEHGPTTTFNRRITGAVWYARDVSGEVFSSWTAQIEYDFVKGVSRIISTGKEIDVQYNVSDAEYLFEVDHDFLATPNLVDSYLSRTGIEDSTPAVKANYATATIVGRKAYIGNVKILNEDGSTEIKGDAMLKSPPNKFDIFPSTSIVEASINDGESIVKLETFADRILQYKQDTLYIINVAQDVEFLEDVHKYKGVKHPSMVCKTDYGIAWVNELGCYFYDGKQVRNLLEKEGRKLISDSVWQTFIAESATSSSMIGYIPEKRQLIITKSNLATTNSGDVFLYDMVTRSWTFGNTKMADVLKSNFIVHQNKLCYMVTDTSNGFLTWKTTLASSTEFEVITKDIDFGEPGRNKKVYKVLVTYDTGNATSNVQVDYDINGGTTFPYDFANGTNFASTELATANGWKVAELKPDVPSEANNIKSFKLRFATDGTVPAGFRINDISIIYKAKRPK
jgi:hypothetical protein